VILFIKTVRRESRGFNRVNFSIRKLYIGLEILFFWLPAVMLEYNGPANI